MSVLDDVRLVWAPPHRAGWPFAAVGIAIAFIGLFVWSGLVWLGVALFAFCLYFFRDPERTPPSRAGTIVAPADGRIVSIALAVPPSELELGSQARWRIAIFLSILDVHINRAPADGAVMRIAYHEGAFVSASMDKASDSNERNAMSIKLAAGGDLAVVQIAGLVARRILCFAQEGQRLSAGERFGLIRFGSRTDLYLPIGVKPLVEEGQRTIGGETVLAEAGRPS